MNRKFWQKEKDQKNDPLYTSGSSCSEAVWYTIGSCMMAGNTVAMSMLVGHLFDLNEMGIFSLSLTTAQILYSLALFGANDLQMTDYHHCFRFSHYFWVKVFSTALTIGICGILILFLLQGKMVRLYTILLTGYMLVNSFAELYQSLFMQNLRFDLSGKAMFYRYLLSTVTFLAVLIQTNNILFGCVWMLIVSIFSALWWPLRYAKKFRDSGYVLEYAQTKRLMRETLPLCLSVMSALLVINAPKYLINAYLSDELQGVYSILFMPTYTVNLAGQFVFKPYLYRYSLTLQRGRREFKKLFIVHAAIIVVCAFVGSISLWLIGAPLFYLLFAQDLRKYRVMMFLFLLSGGLLAVNQILYYIMVILHKQRSVFINFLLGIALTVLLGQSVIPQFSLGGAWLSFTAGQTGLLVGYIFILHYYFKGKESERRA